MINPFAVSVTATVVVYLPKCNRGEHFENLGMLTTLLSKKTGEPARMTNRPLIEVVGGESDKQITHTAY